MKSSQERANALHRAAASTGRVQTQELSTTPTTNADSLKAKIELAKQQVAAAESRIGVAQQRWTIARFERHLRGLSFSRRQVARWFRHSAGGGFTRTGCQDVDMKSNEIEVT